MHMGQTPGDYAYQQMIDLQLPGVPVGYNYDGSPIIAQLPPVGATPNLTPVQQAILNAPQTTSSTDWANVLQNLVTGGLTAYQAISLQNIQADLIKSGRPPLTPYQMASLAPQIGVGVAPDTQNMIFMLAIGGGALLLLMSAMKSKRASSSRGR